MALGIIPLTLDQANALVEGLHRHHKPAVGHRFSLGCHDADGKIVGACIVGRPVARGCDPQLTAEVTRLVTDGTKNACSMLLYAAAARACTAMGFQTIQTYILEDEPGISLRAAGWDFAGLTRGGNWAHSKKFAAQGRRQDQPQGPKQRWVKVLN